MGKDYYKILETTKDVRGSRSEHAHVIYIFGDLILSIYSHVHAERECLAG